jgi:hypothetical protein
MVEGDGSEVDGRLLLADLPEFNLLAFVEFNTILAARLSGGSAIAVSAPIARASSAATRRTRASRCGTRQSRIAREVRACFLSG